MFGRELPWMALVLALAAVVCPWYWRQQQAHDMETCWTNLVSYGTALETYSTDAAGRYPVDCTRLAPRYLRELPQCPVSGEPYQVQTASKPDLYTIVCAGLHHPSWKAFSLDKCVHYTGFPSPTYTAITWTWVKP